MHYAHIIIIHKQRYINSAPGYDSNIQFRYILLQYKFIYILFQYKFLYITAIYSLDIYTHTHAHIYIV